MWELDYKDSWVPKNWRFWTVVLEKTLESPLDFKEIKPFNPERNQSWILIGRTDAEAETPILWPPDAKSQLIRKDPDARKDWRQEEKGRTEDEMVGWHDQLIGHNLSLPPPFPFGNHKFVFEFCESVYLLQINSSQPFWPHIPLVKTSMYPLFI